MGEPQVVSAVGLERTRDIDQDQHATGAFRRGPEPQVDYLSVAAESRGKGPPQVELTSSVRTAAPASQGLGDGSARSNGDLRAVPAHRGWCRSEQALPDNVELIHQDVLQADLLELARRFDGPVRLVLKNLFYWALSR